MPSAATLAGLTNTYGALDTAYSNGGNVLPAYAAAGFNGIITSYQPLGSSSYNGWANTLTRRLNNGLQFVGAYTWSHAIDNSTADVFSTYSTPRRPQDSQNLANHFSSSALDHRNRFTMEVIYDMPYFKHSNWLLKNVVGNWEFAPIYTYQTGTLYTVQSGTDSNLNGDSAGDRAIYNPGGNPSIGTGTTPYNALGLHVRGYCLILPRRLRRAARTSLPMWQTIQVLATLQLRKARWQLPDAIPECCCLLITSICSQPSASPSRSVLVWNSRPASPTS